MRRRKTAAKAVEYLVGLGHRQIGYVGNCYNESRFRGYQNAMFKYNLEMNIDNIINANPDENTGYLAMDKFIHQKNAPTAIYCANDIIAVGMLRCLKKYKGGYYSPSVISSDDIEEAKYTKPMLTTISLPKEEMIRFALSLLSSRINGSHRTTAKIELETTLIIRESCSNINNSMSCEYYI